MKTMEFRKKKNVIANKVRALRMQSGYNQEKLAFKMRVLGVNIDQQAISNIEQNKRIVTDYEMACLCEIFKVSPTEMLEDFSNREKGILAVIRDKYE
jgi:transcriptional regulator with XRE-family HTH domain